MRQGLSQRAYARHRGITHGAVQKAIAAGRIRTLPDGSIEPEAADRDWARNTDETKPRNSVSGDPKHRRRPDEPAQPAENRSRLGSEQNGDGGPSTYTLHRAEREGYSARLARLEYEERTGSLVRADEVKVAAFTTARRLRDRLLSIPARLEATLATTEDAAEIRRILEEEFRLVLEEMQPAPAGTAAEP